MSEIPIFSLAMAFLLPMVERKKLMLKKMLIAAALIGSVSAANASTLVSAASAMCGGSSDVALS
jgi:hypothetical protein